MPPVNPGMSQIIYLSTSLMADFHGGIRLTGFLYLAGFIMEPFLEGITLLKHLYINPNKNSNKFFSELTYQTP